MNIKEEIKNDILNKGTFNNKLTDYGEQIWTDFISGSWCESDYLKCQSMKKETNKRKLRTFVIFSYCSLIAKNYDCSYGYAQKCLVSLFGIKSLETINDNLIDELKQY